MLQRVLLWPML
jgi:hypothetical protein